jgi:peptidyl-dipeptidase A
MEKLTGRRVMDASSIVKYFEPVAEWLKEENRDRRCGW